MTPTPDWLTPGEALARILARCPVLPVETLDLVDDQAEFGPDRALAEDIVAEVDHPPWDNSAMDGFAVHVDDVADASESAPIVLPISGDVPAGSFPAGALRRGTAVRVMTGAPVPEGATGVIRVEHTDVPGEHPGPYGAVRVLRASDAERNIRRRGEDLRRGIRSWDAARRALPPSSARWRCSAGAPFPSGVDRASGCWPTETSWPTSTRSRRCAPGGES